MRLNKIIGIVFVVLACVLSLGNYWRKGFGVKQLETLSVYFPLKMEIPDPAKIENTGQWYLLGHITSSLSQFDHKEARFKPLLASVEAFSGGTHTFTLLDSALFHDGTPITSDDVIKSIKRLLILKTSTHFPLWQYVEGCENLKSFSDECSGLKKLSDKKIEIRLKVLVEDFQLQMASPETGIWYHGDISDVGPDFKIVPTKFSGPYFVKTMNTQRIALGRNEYNFISKIFPDSPKEIVLPHIQSEEIIKSFKNKKIDIAIRSRNPMDKTNYSELGLNIFASSPATLIYLHGAGKLNHQGITRQFIETLWKTNPDNLIVPADNFLPFDPSMSISREEFLNELPKKASQPIKIGVPWTYLSEEFYKFIKSTSDTSDCSLTLIPLTPKEWMDALMNGSGPHGIDYVLAVYAASARYPAVQLRYITGKVRGPQIDLKGVDTPELSLEKKDLIQKYQLALLKSQYAVPLFFAKHQMIFRQGLDLGEQPPTDAEVELWRVVAE